MAQKASQPWNCKGEDKRTYVRRMFAEISPTYDLLNSAMSLRLHHRWRSQAVSMLDLRPGDSVADICCGTGDFGKPLRRAVATGLILGVDFCRPMLELASKKGHKMVLSLGDACALPLRNESVSGVTIGWGLRNIADVPLALKEVHRILKTGGKFASIEMATPRSKFLRRTNSIIFNRLIPFLGKLVGNKLAYTYLPKSTETFYTRAQLTKLMQDAGFKNIAYEDRFYGNICIYRGEK